MFDLSWSELLVLGAVALLLIGPKELPAFLRMLGKYAGVVKRHAAEFRAHFDAAMREAELDSLKKEVDDLKRRASDALDETTRALPSDSDMRPLDGKPARREPDALDAPKAHNENNPLNTTPTPPADAAPNAASGKGEP